MRIKKPKTVFNLQTRFKTRYKQLHLPFIFLWIDFRRKIFNFVEVISFRRITEWQLSFTRHKQASYSRVHRFRNYIKARVLIDDAVFSVDQPRSLSHSLQSGYLKCETVCYDKLKLDYKG